MASGLGRVLWIAVVLLLCCKAQSSQLFQARLLANASLAAFDDVKASLACRDQLGPSCPGPDECARNPEFMMFHCAKTCNNCDQQRLLGTAREALLYSLRAAAVAKPEVAQEVYALVNNENIGQEAVDFLQRIQPELKVAARAASGHGSLDTPNGPQQELLDKPLQLFASAQYFSDAARDVEAKFGFNPESLNSTSVARLADGHHIPLVGYGTFDAHENDVAMALAAGYRLIDTTEEWQNGAEIGRALARSGLKRSDIFLVNGLAQDSFGRAKTLAAFARQLKDVGTEYFDLYMPRGPSGDVELFLETWRTLEELVDQGKIRSLGVSNFDKHWLDKLWASARRKPVYIQNKFSPYHPGHTQLDGFDLLHYCREKRIFFVGFSSINPWPGTLDPRIDGVLSALAHKNKVSVVQVVHRWVLQLGAGVIPRSRQQAHIQENRQLFHFNLTPEEVALISQLHWLAHDRNNKPFFPNMFGVQPIGSSPPPRKNLNAISVAFHNDLQRPLELLWSGPDSGYRTVAEHVQPGGVVYQQSFIGQVFGYRDAGSKRGLRRLKIKGGGPTVSTAVSLSDPLGAPGTPAMAEDGRVFLKMSSFAKQFSEEM